ncbi:unnamed protein product [Alternaria alternata]
MAQHTLLASNYGCVDARDTIYVLRGLMKLPKDGHMLDPDYSKSRLELYRDSVEAALMNFEKADVLLYITRQEEPSWIPRWNIPMLFFNRFRFGKPMPWKPTGDTKSTWSISTDTNVLSLSGFSLDVITHAESYDQLNFAISIIDSVEGKTRLKDLWTRNLHTFAATLDGTLPLTRSFLTAAAVSLSFGMSHKINAFEQFELLYNFVGYLDIVLAGDRAILTTPKPGDLLEESNSATGVLPSSTSLLLFLMASVPFDRKSLYAEVTRDDETRMRWKRMGSSTESTADPEDSHVWNTSFPPPIPPTNPTGSMNYLLFDLILDDRRGDTIEYTFSDRPSELAGIIRLGMILRYNIAKYRDPWSIYNQHQPLPESPSYTLPAVPTRHVEPIKPHDLYHRSAKDVGSVLSGVRTRIAEQRHNGDTKFQVQEQPTKSEVVSKSSDLATYVGPTPKKDSVDREGTKDKNEVGFDSELFPSDGSVRLFDDSLDADIGPYAIASGICNTAHLMPLQGQPSFDWKKTQASFPPDWQWDVEYHTTKTHHGGQHGSWTCTPLEPNEPKCYPLTIAGAPVVLPVEYRWPPESGLTPPPDPRATMPIDCRATLPLELVIDLFLTFQDSIGFYILINGLLQVIVSEDYDTSWASSHLPHKYGGLKVCYIEQNLEPTMLPSATNTSRATTSGSPVGSHDISGIFRPASLSTQSVTRYPSLKLNDFIEARPLSNHRRERFSGRVGLRVTRAGLESLVVMSTHVITEAILAKSHRDTIFGRGRDDRFKKLEDDWNEHVEIWAGDKKIGTIDKTFDREVKLYPVGFDHDITLIKPSSPAVVEDVASPIANLGWLHQDSWNLLRQQTSTVKILADTGSSQSGKSIKCSRPSDVLVVGEGIFLNQRAAAGSSRSLKDHDASTWKDLVSRAILYRVYPDFDPPNGHSGTALYADGIREDGTVGPGIVGFQSFVQRSGKVQNFDMEGPALEQRLKLGVVAFYGAFEVPAELKQYGIV